MLKYIANLGAEELERTLGFAPGRLKSGFRLVILAQDETITEDDFELKASTRWSRGAIGKSGSTGEGTNIEKLLNARGQNVALLKGRVASFFAERGGNTPAKIVANLKHNDDMDYPDATALGPKIRSGVPQFTLRKGIHKKGEIFRSKE